MGVEVPSGPAGGQPHGLDCRNLNGFVVFSRQQGPGAAAVGAGQGPVGGQQGRHVPCQDETLEYRT